MRLQSPGRKMERCGVNAGKLRTLPPMKIAVEDVPAMAHASAEALAAVRGRGGLGGGWAIWGFR